MDDHMDTGSNSGASQDGGMEGGGGPGGGGDGGPGGNRELLSDEESYSSPAVVAGPSGLSAASAVVFAPRFPTSEVAQAVLAPPPPPRMEDDNIDEDNNSNLDFEGILAELQFQNSWVLTGLGTSGIPRLEKNGLSVYAAEL